MDFVSLTNEELRTFIRDKSQCNQQRLQAAQELKSRNVLITKRSLREVD